MPQPTLGAEDMTFCGSPLSRSLLGVNRRTVCLCGVYALSPMDNGWDLNVLGQAGPSRASPSRIWVENWNEGAIYSPDGMIIQFDRGMIWQRALANPPCCAEGNRGLS